MDYYYSWTQGDPIFQHYFSDVRLLVSPPNVSLSWKIGNWPSSPAALIIDSGAFQYYRKKRDPSLDVVLNRQLQLVEGTDLPCGICHMDIPLLGARSIAELDQRITRNLEQAQWFIQSISKREVPPHIQPIGVIQGYNSERVYVVAQALADMGYSKFALGSLAKMVANSKDEIMRRVEAALEAVGPNLHILGVSSVTVLAKLAQLGIKSADSSAPIHEAWRGGLFYSSPFRRYKIPSPHFREWSRNYSFSEILEAPLPCDCPVCILDSQRLMEPHGKQFIILRAIHNYYHLTREIEETR